MSRTASRTVGIANRRGLHARASARFVTLAAAHESADIEVEKDGTRVCGTSIMGLMMLGAAMGDTITIHVKAADPDPVLAELAALVEGRFGEE